MRFIRQPQRGLSQLYATSQTMLSTKTPSIRIAFMTHSIRSIGLITAILLFAFALFQLFHLPAASINHDLLDLWRGLAVGSLYLLFCLSTGRPSHSDL